MIEHPASPWAPTDEDRRQIKAHGLSVEEVERQLEMLSRPRMATRLDRACTAGDGIVRLRESRFEHYQSLFEAAAHEGRFSKFVPASGAASRMFKALIAAYRGEAGDPSAAQQLLQSVDRLPFKALLEEHLQQRGHNLQALVAAGDAAPILDVVLGEQGLNFAATAKALIPFHVDVDGRGLTALEEQLVETAEHLRDASGRCKAHFTIPQHQELLFRSELREITARLESRFKVRFELSLSVQGPETDTIAASLDGGPFRDDDGRLLFRPGGHGSLLSNLQRFQGDLVFLRNIDNIQPAHRRRQVLRWNRLLGGYLLELEAELVEILGRLERARSFETGFGAEAGRISDLLGLDLSAVLERSPREQQARLIALLDRPLRIAGVVPNTGEPGGGPFWVVDGDGGMSPQIVELSQVDQDDPQQAEIVRGATHFNPVHLVCRLRDHHGEAFELSRFVDQDAAFSSVKSHQGRDLKALEHPGLWNGSMAHWNTVFVEVPGEIFAPVKTVFDLLRPEHQPEP